MGEPRKTGRWEQRARILVERGEVPPAPPASELEAPAAAHVGDLVDELRVALQELRELIAEFRGDARKEEGNG